MLQFRKTEERVAPYLEELSALWRSIVYGRSEDTSIAMEGFYRAGVDIDIPEVVREWPKIEAGKLEETRIYKKPVEKVRMRERPELIRVHLVCDLSGSMDKNKRKVLQDTATLLLRSLEEFQTYLNMTRSLTKSKMNVGTDVWGFSDAAYRLKSFPQRPGEIDEAERAAVITAIGGLGSMGGGSTFDDAALLPIAEAIEEEPGAREAIRKEKVMEIVLEITDGGSSNPEGAKAALKKLEQLGGGKVIARALQIGEVMATEKKIFHDVWGENGEEIGTKIEKLPKAVAILLAKYLGGIKL